MAKKLHVSFIGPFRHAWFNKPDTKYNADGLYHGDLIGQGQEAEDMAEKIEAACVAALAKHTDKMGKAEAAKWSIVRPYEREVDDETGEPTGRIIFSFKQNAKIKVDGVEKEVRISIRDAKNQEFNAPIYSGSEGRVKYSMRDIVVATSKQAGVRLDFGSVQITKLQQGGGGFDEVEGGFSAEGSQQGGRSAPQEDQEEQY